VSSSQQHTAPRDCDVLRVNSALLRTFPWHTRVVLELPKFLGNVGSDSLMDVRQNSIRTRLTHGQSTYLKKQVFLSTLDKCEETILFTTGACGDGQDYDVQSMLGIQVTAIDNAKETVSSRPNASVETLGALRASSLFSMLARYRLVDVLALMEGVHPYPTPVPKSPAPAGLSSLPVCQFLRASPLFSMLKLLVLRWNEGLGESYGELSRGDPSRCPATAHPQRATFEHPTGVATKPGPNGINAEEG